MSGGRTGTLAIHLEETIAQMLKTAEKLLDLRQEDEDGSLHRLIQSVVEGGHVDYGLLDGCRDLIDEYKDGLDPHGSFEKVVLLRDQLDVLYERVNVISAERRAAHQHWRAHFGHDCTKACFERKA